MKYKTRGNAHPQGKPRVFFTGHPRDITLFFDKITDMILQRQNCAIFYDEDPTWIDDEEMYFSDLRQMQLIVIVVTSNFLYRENIAFNKVFRFAMENHIPVLPIMEERGLESEFNRLCGDLQFLDPNATDLTAISFEEKLSKYLSSVLVGDEMAAKVRAAFDAYVFLSYRKKDRKYAQELMRLIHKNEFCRDIAIWYDEFLVPGENFNESIKTALDKSELFALVVTPNLVNEENYVMTTEYPMAKKADKRILPAELLPTDTEILKTSFPQIPECTDPNDEKALAETLLKSLEHVAKMENDNDPQHNFFIGLAYLSGIDVEVNHERAVELITSSAYAGLPEAIEKIVTMYRSGEGVVRNYEMALEWQQQLVNVRQKNFEIQKTKENIINLLDAIWWLGDYMLELGIINQAAVVFGRMGDVCLLEYKNYDPYIARKYLSTSYSQQGLIEMMRGNLKSALKFFQLSVGIDEKLAKENNDPKLRLLLSVSYDRLGDIYKLLKNTDMALLYYKASFGIVFQLDRENALESKYDLIISYLKVGTAYSVQSKLSLAFEYYDKALENATNMVKIDDTIRAKSTLSGVYNNLGVLYKRKGNLEKALSYHEKSMEIRKEIVIQSDTFMSKWDLAQSNRNLGGLYELKGEYEKTVSYYRKAIDLLEDVVKDSQIADAYDKFAYLNYKIWSITGERKYLERAHIVYVNLTGWCNDTKRYEKHRDMVFRKWNELFNKGDKK